MRLLQGPVLLVLLLAPHASQAQWCGQGEPLLCCETIEPEFSSFDVDGAINATDVAAIDTIRQNLIELVWPATGQLPAGVQPTLDTDIPYSPEPNGFLVIDGLATQIDSTNPDLQFDRIDKLTYSMTIAAGTFTTSGWLFVPSNPNGRSIIVHQGHTNIPGALQVGNLIREVVNRGFHTIFVPMLGRDPNSTPPGPKIWLNHTSADFEALETPSFHPLSLFLEPQIAMVNHLVQDSFWEIDMFGHSGGGWTTLWVAALDTRVTKSFSNAGNMPEYLRGPTTNCSKDGNDNDYEQQHDERDGLASVLDLYVLASHGSSREHRGYFNQYDNCCFYGIKHETYAANIETRVQSLDSGDYSQRIERVGLGHAVHEGTREDVLSSLSTAPGPCEIGPDVDSDGIVDRCDNCTEVANADQRDTNQDGFGNSCDPDYNDDLVVGFPDFVALAASWNSTEGEPGYDPDRDTTGDGVIGFADFTLLSGFWLGAPGPSGLACAGSAPCP